MYFCAIQRQAIHSLKQMRWEETDIFLVQNGIPYYVSYSNSLVPLYKLVEKHLNLQKCTVELQVIMKNMKTVDEVCTELNW